MKKNKMTNYARIHEHDQIYSVCFYVDTHDLFETGEKMNALHEEAYMNGYNWEAFFNYYLAKHYPKIVENMNTDPEAGMYAAYFQKNADNKVLADKFVDVINELFSNRELLFEIVREEGSQIEWD